MKGRLLACRTGEGEGDGLGEVLGCDHPHAVYMGNKIGYLVEKKKQKKTSLFKLKKNKAIAISRVLSLEKM